MIIWIYGPLQRTASHHSIYRSFRLCITYVRVIVSLEYAEGHNFLRSDNGGQDVKSFLKSKYRQYVSWRSSHVEPKPSLLLLRINFDSVPSFTKFWYLHFSNYLPHPRAISFSVFPYSSLKYIICIPCLVVFLFYFVLCVTTTQVSKFYSYLLFGDIHFGTKKKDIAT